MTSPASAGPAKPQGLRRSVYGPSGLRAGWRLVIFLAILLGLDAAKGLALETLLHSSDEIVRYLLLRRSGDLWMAIGFHTAWNWGQSFFYGVPDSGASVPGDLFNPTFLGPA